MRKKWLVAAIVFSVLGIVVSIISAVGYFNIQKAGFEHPSFCSINGTINCDLVNASSYAVLFGIPVALWGLLFYAVVLLFAFYLRLAGEPKNAALSFLWAFVLAGFAWTVRMAYISAFVLHAFCITCILQYAANIVLVISVWAAGKISFKEKISVLFSRKIVAPVLTAAAVFGVGYVFALSAAKNSGPKMDANELKSMAESFSRQSLYDIKPEDLENVPSWGNKDAKVTIAVFSDFQCPFCRLAAFNIKPYLQEFRDDVRFVFLNYPLDNSCNKYMTVPMHPKACLAAKAAMCAQEKGKFWEYHDGVFRNQTKISREFLLDLAAREGIEKDWMNQCIDDKEIAAKMSKDIDLAQHIYLAGTPSVFVNRKVFSYWRFPEALRAVIKEELKK